MKEISNDQELKGADGAAIVFGIINLAFVGLFFLIKKMFLGAGFALLFMLGSYSVYHAIKSGIKEKNIKCLCMGVLGLILHVFSLGLLGLLIIRIFTV
ncbi:MAG: hypothetical protein J6W58_00985 [Lachnospiraceae bacterium]|nr:hypothetical protein [Lachnospiraceae bacterium]MBP5414243.1 hypothetical protein [Lachnospiraceae bacterium]MBP5744857.1 hypothetical protein [Lachnospiraceae bacterium]